LVFSLSNKKRNASGESRFLYNYHSFI